MSDESITTAFANFAKKAPKRILGLYLDLADSPAQTLGLDRTNFSIAGKYADRILANTIASAPFILGSMALGGAPMAAIGAATAGNLLTSGIGALAETIAQKAGADAPKRVGDLSELGYSVGRIASGLIGKGLKSLRPDLVDDLAKKAGSKSASIRLKNLFRPANSLVRKAADALDAVFLPDKVKFTEFKANLNAVSDELAKLLSVPSDQVSAALRKAKNATQARRELLALLGLDPEPAKLLARKPEDAKRLFLALANIKTSIPDADVVVNEVVKKLQLEGFDDIRGTIREVFKDAKIESDELKRLIFGATPEQPPRGELTGDIANLAKYPTPEETASKIADFFKKQFVNIKPEQIKELNERLVELKAKAITTKSKEQAEALMGVVEIIDDMLNAFNPNPEKFAETIKAIQANGGSTELAIQKILESLTPKMKQEQLVLRLASLQKVVDKTGAGELRDYLPKIRNLSDDAFNLYNKAAGKIFNPVNLPEIMQRFENYYNVQKAASNLDLGGEEFIQLAAGKNTPGAKKVMGKLTRSPQLVANLTQNIEELKKVNPELGKALAAQTSDLYIDFARQLKDAGIKDFNASEGFKKLASILGQNLDLSAEDIQKLEEAAKKFETVFDLAQYEKARKGVVQTGSQTAMEFSKINRAGRFGLLGDLFDMLREGVKTPLQSETLARLAATELVSGEGDAALRTLVDMVQQDKALTNAMIESGILGAARAMSGLRAEPIHVPEPADFSEIDRVLGFAAPSEQDVDAQAILRILQDAAPTPAPTPSPTPSPTPLIEGLKQKTTFKTKGGKEMEASKLASLIAKIESDYNENAISPRGAIGLMQLMPATAKMLGINPLVAEENVRGGEEYIFRLLDQFGDLDKALAAYNWGEGNLQKAIQKYGDKWHQALPAETRNYLKRFYTELFNASE